MAGSLRLLTPGLLGPVPAAWWAGPAAVLPGGSSSRRLSRLLARGDRLEGLADDPIAALLAAFGVPLPDEADLPSAPFACLADAPQEVGPPGRGYWLHADPVHLHPDRDQVRLFDGRSLDLTPAEAHELVALFNGHFRATGVRLLAPSPARWYLHLGAAPALRTTPLETVVGRPVAPFLPRGEDADHWAVLLNEAQMLFHTAEVNRRREAAGRASVNAIWPWGGGTLPAPPRVAPFGQAHGAAPLLLGLARWAGVPYAGEALPALADEARVGARIGYWDLPLQALRDEDPQAWSAAVARLDAWLADLPAAVRQGRLGELVLEPGLGRGYRADRRTLRRTLRGLWRGPAPLRAHLARA